MHSNIPVVDLSSIISVKDFDVSDPSICENFKNIGREIANAFENIGFVYLINHNVAQRKYNEMLRVSKEIFDLPTEKKNQYSRSNTINQGQGYVPFSAERLEEDINIQEFKESFDFNSTTGIYPKEVPDSRKVVTDLVEDLKFLSLLVLKSLEAGLDLPEGRLLGIIKHIFTSANGTSLRILHYPPIPEGVKTGVIRCGAHTDYGLFTILNHDNISGLEVLNKQNQWIKAQSVPGAVLVNIGEMFPKFTGNLFQATVHKVCLPENEQERKRTRRSVVFFVHPDKNVLIKSMFGKKEQISRTKTAEEFLNKRFQDTLKQF